jgi:hypothetical protein
MAQPEYAASFQVTGVTPPAAYSCLSAPTCTVVTVQGQGFNVIAGCVGTCFGPHVLFGGAEGIIGNITDTQITVRLPVHPPETVDVTVIGLAPNPESSTLPAGFTFLDPAGIPALDRRTLTLLALALALIGWITSARLQ